MMNNMFSREIINLINTLINENMNINTLRNFIKENIKEISSELKIGKLEIKSMIPIGLYNENLVEENHVYFEIEGNIGEKLFQTYKTKYNGHVTVITESLNNYKWTDEEKEQIKTLNNILFSFTSRKKQDIVLDNALITDSMTEICNMNGLLNFTQTVADTTKYATIFLNIKNFKFINQKYGMPFGNVVLKIFAQTIKERIGSDNFISRVGGDNFVLVILKDQLNEIIEYIKCVNINHKGIQLSLYTRFGINIIVNNIPLMAEVEKANLAMIYSRKSKTDIVYFDQFIMTKISKEKEILNYFPKGLQDNEFAVYYQPKVNIEDKSLLVGGEALVRWIKDGKMIPPNEFIPLLEKDDNICKLDFYVLEKVCIDIDRWIKNGITPVKISINFSKNHLTNPNLLQNILEIIDKYSVPHELIEIEITESAATNNISELTDLINNLHKNNIEVSLDDFGTGYASLCMLREVPIDIVKIDKSLVDYINNNNKDVLFFKNIINLINEMGLKTVIEGVETKEQIDFLKNNNCFNIQGYYFDKPLCSFEFENKLKNKYYNK